MSIWSATEAQAGGFFRPQGPQRSRLLRPANAVAATAAAVLALALAVLSPPTFIAEPAPRRTLQPSSWAAIVTPVRMFALSTPTFGPAARAYSAKRNAADGARIDTLDYGPAELGAGNWMTLQIHRFGAEAPAAAPFVAEMARHAARSAHALGGASLTELLPTRFGDMEIADIRMAKDDRQTNCTGFRLRREEPGLSIASLSISGLSISGLACGAPARPLDRKTLACAIDRLELVGTGADAPLAAFFASATLRGLSECPPARAAAPETQPQAAPLKRTMASAQSRRRQ